MPGLRNDNLYLIQHNLNYNKPGRKPLMLACNFQKDIMVNTMEELDKTMFGIARKLLYETRGGFYTLNQYAAGREMRIELVGEEIAEDLQLEPDQVIEGYLTDAHRALMWVEAASHLTDLAGREIGLGMITDLATPGGVVRDQNLRGCVAPGRSFAYYFPEDIPAISKYGTPSQWHNMAASYGRVVVAGVELFDV
jgi:hypothetical protein